LPNGVQFTWEVRPNLLEGGRGAPTNAVTKTAINHAPVAVDDPGYNTAQGVTLNVAAPGVLGNDTDDDSPTSLIRAVPQIAALTQFGGHVTLNADGSFAYTPAAGFSGTDTFTYTANDGLWIGDNATALSPDSSAATVTITVVDTTPPMVTVTVPAPNGSN